MPNAMPPTIAWMNRPAMVGMRIGMSIETAMSTDATITNDAALAELVRQLAGDEHGEDRDGHAREHEERRHRGGLGLAEGGVHVALQHVRG